MKVVGHQRPSVNREVRRLDEGRDARQKIEPVGVVEDDRAALDAAIPDVLQSQRGIQTSRARHTKRVRNQQRRRYQCQP